jgi:Ca2+-binding RTX toxin-like protein
MTDSTAGPIGINGTVLTAFGTAGDDALVVTASATELFFSGTTFDIVTPGCIGSGTMNCGFSGLTEVRINMLSGDDVVDLRALPALAGLIFTVLGGDGSDVLLAGDGDYLMFGGALDDVLIGGAGLSCLSGGSGDNILIGSKCDPGEEPVFGAAQPNPAPEPGTLALLGLGLAGLATTRRRKQ